MKINNKIDSYKCYNSIYGRPQGRGAINFSLLLNLIPVLLFCVQGNTVEALLILLQGDLDKAWTFLLVLLGPSPAPGKGSSYSM